MANSSNDLNNIPEELWLCIFQYTIIANPKSYLALNRVCKKWHNFFTAKNNFSNAAKNYFDIIQTLEKLIKGQSAWASLEKEYSGLTVISAKLKNTLISIDHVSYQEQYQLLKALIQRDHSYLNSIGLEKGNDFLQVADSLKNLLEIQDFQSLHKYFCLPDNDNAAILKEFSTLEKLKNVLSEAKFIRIIKENIKIILSNRILHLQLNMLEQSPNWNNALMPYQNMQLVSANEISKVQEDTLLGDITAFACSLSRSKIKQMVFMLSSIILGALTTGIGISFKLQLDSNATKDNIGSALLIIGLPILISSLAYFVWAYRREKLAKNKFKSYQTENYTSNFFRNPLNIEHDKLAPLNSASSHNYGSTSIRYQRLNSLY